MSGWRARYSRSEGYQWTLIGKMDPQLPQMFYPVLENVTITTGDIIVRYLLTVEREECHWVMGWWQMSVFLEKRGKR